MDKSDRRWLTVLLDKAAKMVSYNPLKRWPQWIIYLLEALQGKTDAEHYEEFLRNLKRAITARLEDGRW